MGYCHLCGKSLTAEGKTYRHKKWQRGVYLKVCDDCEQHKPRCRQCGIPIADNTVNGVCTTCNQNARICLSCGRKIRGKYYLYDEVGPYCDRCRKERQACDVCSAPLTDKKWELSDGRVMCALCHASGVFTPESAEELYAEMKAVVLNTLGFKLNVPTGLALVDRRQLREIIERQTSENPQDGFDGEIMNPDTTLGIFTRRGYRRGIYMQTGLPRMLFLQVAAHEYAHAWQGENCPFLLDKLKHEGFAEWSAYHVLGYYGYQRGRERMIKRQDIYGKGLRWALKLEEQAGARAVIQACRRPEDEG